MLATLIILFKTFVPAYLLLAGFSGHCQKYFPTVLGCASIGILTWLLGNQLALVRHPTLLVFMFCGLIIFSGWLRDKWSITNLFCALRLTFFSKSTFYDTLIIFLYIIYVLRVGAYLEIPADVFFHLGAINEARLEISSGVGLVQSPWYFLIATALHLAEEDIQDFIGPFTVLMGSAFLLGIRYFSLYIASLIGLTSGRATTFSLIAVGLTFLQFGTDLFSYVRYYTFSPGPISYLVFLGSCVALDRFNQHPIVGAGLLRSGTFLLLASLTTYFLHKQELLFISVVLLFYLGSRATNVFVNLFASDHLTKVIYFSGYCFTFLAVSMIFGFLGGLNEPRFAPLSDHTLELPIELFSSYQFQIADPLGRVFQTYGAIGVISAIGFLFIVPIQFRIQLILALTIAPVIFMFNPLSAGWFLQHSEPTVLWRLSYMYPVGVVAAICLFSIVKWARVFSVLRLFMFAAIVLLLFPISLLREVQHHRWPTLVAVNEANSPMIWADLIDFFAVKGHVNVLTDPVTGYILSGLSPVAHAHRKFQEVEAGSLARENYSTESFLDHAKEGDWWIVVNLRDGAESNIGIRSGHWPYDIVKVRQHYSRNLLSWLKVDVVGNSNSSFTHDPANAGHERPTHLRLEWHEDRIWVFSLRNPK